MFVVIKKFVNYFEQMAFTCPSFSFYTSLQGRIWKLVEYSQISGSNFLKMSLKYDDEEKEKSI